MSIYKTITGKLHNALQNDFWLQLVEGISEELELQKATKKEKITLNDLDSENESDLLQLAEKYGYEPNLTLDSSIENLRDEVKSITFRIKNKTTNKGFQYSFFKAGRLGEVYNTTYDVTKLARLVDKDTTITNVMSQDPSLPFTGVVPELIFFETESTGVVSLDKGRTLDDEDDPWTVDNTGLIQTTKHITLEVFLDRLITLDSIDYSVTSSYIEFLLSESSYNKRSTSIPHVGIQINSVIDTNKSFDSQSLGGDYTIPDIKLQSALTQGTTNQLFFDSDLILDDGLLFDEGISPDAGDSLEDYVYFIAGIGKKGLPSSEHINIFKNRVLHLPFTGGDSDSLFDAVATYTVTAVGSLEKVKGILGRSLDYQHNTYAKVESFTFPTSWSLNFWLNVGDSDYNIINIVSHENFQITYNKLSSKVEVTLKDGTNTYTDSLDIETNKDTYLIVEYDDTTETAYCYIDSEFVISIDTTGNLGFTATNDLFIGTDYTDVSNTELMFKGLIDEFSIHSELFSSDEKSFLYDNQYGDLTYMANPVYSVAMTSEEKTEITNVDDYILLQGIAKGNTVNNETLFESNGSDLSFSKNLKFYPIEKGGLKISFNNSTEDILIKDDKNGNIESDLYSGTIDYNTGLINFNFFKDIENNNVVYSSSSETSVSIILDPTVQTNLFYLEYFYNGVAYTAQDNGLGVIVGDNIDSGTIDYNTGEVEVTFTNATDEEKVIRYSYTNRVQQVPLSGEKIEAEYQTSIDLELTECGYANADGVLVQYTSFPPCKFGTPRASLINNTIVKL